MLWAENRKTTRGEDRAYSLLGIFDVYMPLIYAEGEEKAFKRLQEEIDKASKGTSLSPTYVGKRCVRIKDQTINGQNREP